ncbi:glycerol uptake facilitator protein [Maridesulfovibrio ferrireducens]|uniref:Glycerol uptake facilitator protein n=1 Tax=Maridesulfovibrio ferrireducens TaxID=246191 RepID=A0A1G9IXX1_9BACT|nr:MIP/aquaporin family protein [Maridesulfovibrio ferrireducens]SDL30119.1 glycerol uptake facilitator protein [Maridesulfovibrio ferrireducens]
MNFFLSEMIGTMILTLFGCGVVANVLLEKSKGQNGGWIVISMGWGFAVAFAVYVAGKHSGAHINPAVTIGLASIGAFPWANVPVYIAGQMTGGFLGAVLCYFVYQCHWEPTKDPELKLAVFATGPAIPCTIQNFLCEFIGTACLLFLLLGIGANEFSQGLNPLVIGFLIMAIGLSLGGPTGYAINPARDLAPRIAHMLLPIPGKGGSNWGYAWVPIVAPICGGVAGAMLYKTLIG